MSKVENSFFLSQTDKDTQNSKCLELGINNRKMTVTKLRVLLLFTPIYLTPYNLTPYIITPQSFNPAIYSPRNRFNTEIFYLFRHPKEQLAKLKFKGLKQHETTDLQECGIEQLAFVPNQRIMTRLLFRTMPLIEKEHLTRLTSLNQESSKTVLV